jgi:hypothetical protein
MRGLVPPDPEGGVSEIQFAVVYAPNLNKSGRNRKRFSANCIELKTTADEAYACAAQQSDRYAAKVLGPSKSSEGQYIFYLIEWLTSGSET